MRRSPGARSVSALLVALLLILMLPGLVAGAGENKAKRIACIRAAERALGVDLHHSQFKDIVLGTDGADPAMDNPPGATLICGFKGKDTVGGGSAKLQEGDIFVGGGGRDDAYENAGGIFIGGRGDDHSKYTMLGAQFLGGEGDDASDFVMTGSLFIGGPGDDTVLDRVNDATFKGGPGRDRAKRLYGTGRFYGKRGNDRVTESICHEGRFIGGPGRDSVKAMDGGSFHGKKGIDRIEVYDFGKYWSVEDVTPGTFACP